jgi:hypothetical protein
VPVVVAVALKMEHLDLEVPEVVAPEVKVVHNPEPLAQD